MHKSAFASPACQLCYLTPDGFTTSRKSNELKNDLHSTPGVLTHYESARYTGVGLQNSLHPCFFLIDSVLGVFGVECRSLLSSFEINESTNQRINDNEDEDDKTRTITITITMTKIITKMMTITGKQ